MNLQTSYIPAASFPGRLAVHTAGPQDAPAIVLSHSILASSRMWAAQLQMLGSCGLRVVGIDTRGHGASDEPPPDCTMDDLVGDCVHVLDELGIAKAHFLGLSLGGMIGLGSGILYPERIRSLVICDARADAPAAFAAPWDERAAVARERGTRALAESTLNRWFGQDFLLEHPDTARDIESMIAGTSVGGFTACARALQKLDYLGRVKRIRAPIQWIVGANDGVLPEAMRNLQSLCPGSMLTVIEGAGHLPNIDRPEFFNAAVMRHLNHFNE